MPLWTEIHRLVLTAGFDLSLEVLMVECYGRSGQPFICLFVRASVGMNNIAVFVSGQSPMQMARKQLLDSTNGCSFSSTF